MQLQTTFGFTYLRTAKNWSIERPAPAGKRSVARPQASQSMHLASTKNSRGTFTRKALMEIGHLVMVVWLDECERNLDLVGEAGRAWRPVVAFEVHAVQNWTRLHGSGGSCFSGVARSAIPSLLTTRTSLVGISYFAKRILTGGVAPMENCRCTSKQHGHPLPCPSPATEGDKLCKPCHDAAAEETAETKAAGSIQDMPPALSRKPW